jgi:hypothetical protein
VADGHSHGGDGADAEPLHGGVVRARLITDWSVVGHLSQFYDSCCLGRRGVHRDRAACATVDGAPFPLGWNGVSVVFGGWGRWVCGSPYDRGFIAIADAILRSTLPEGLFVFAR